MDLNKLKIKALEIANKKGWNKGSSKHYICLVISELMEAVEADRKNKHANLDMFYIRTDKNNLKKSLEAYGNDGNYYYNIVWKDQFEYCIKDTVEDELADAFIRLLHLAGLWEAWGVNRDGIDIFPMYNEYNYNTFTEWVYCVVGDLMTRGNYAVRYGLSHIFGYCINNHIDLERHVIEKMRYNELREFDKAY